MGIDVSLFLDRAIEMAEACRLAEGNPGLELGRSLGEQWRAGRDKICIEATPGGFGLWAEQLLAESTGKQGKGLIPAPGEPADGPDRQAQEVRLSGEYELAQEFFRWEFATAVAGSILGINPFDQPDVQSAKDKTKEVLASGSEPDVSPAGSAEELFAQAQRGRLRLHPGVRRSDGRERERESRGSPSARGRDRLRRHARLRAALPALDRAAAQGRAADGPLPAGRRRHGRRAGDPRAAVRVREADPRAGRWGFRVVAGARPPGRAHPSRGGLSSMQLGMIGLGRMGSGMTKRIEQHGHEVKTYDPQVASTAKTLGALKKQLDAPRHVWMMIPAGEITEKTFQQLLKILEPGDTIVDGGNSNFRDSQRRYKEARKQKISFVDVGVSGGIWGLEVGFCLMAGGDARRSSASSPFFHALAPEDGYAHVGAVRRGAFHEDGAQRHRVRADAGLRRGLRGDAEVGVRSRPARDRRHLALRLGRPLVAARAAARGFEKEGGELEAIRGYVEDSGEGRWTIAEAIAEDVPVPVISAALFARFASRQEESFAAKVNAALRNQFGGHAVQAVEQAKAATQDPRA